jgi:membrane protease YdiL (CAAX protease family)
MARTKRAAGIAGAIFAGLIYFTVLMGASQALVALNANLTPAVPWFPLPALLLVFIITRWVTRYGSLRLNSLHNASTDQRAPMKAYWFALLLTVAAICLGTLEARFHQLIVPVPAWPGENASRAFQWTFLLVIPFIAAVLAEIGFRGIMQTRLEKLMPLWPMLLLIAVLNFLMHFYDPDQGDQIIRLIALNLAWGYVTWRVQSIRPALVAHVAMNIVLPLLQYRSEAIGAGPLSYGDLGSGLSIAVAVVGALSFTIAVFIGRNLPHRNRSETIPQ